MYFDEFIVHSITYMNTTTSSYKTQCYLTSLSRFTVALASEAYIHTVFILFYTGVCRFYRNIYSMLLSINPRGVSYYMTVPKSIKKWMYFHDNASQEYVFSKCWWSVKVFVKENYMKFVITELIVSLGHSSLLMINF